MPLRFFERLGSKDEEKLFGREHWHSDSRDVADKGEETGMNAYRHTMQYYETDRMGIVHHSNYIRWMEEARVDYLAQLGWGLERLEAMGSVSPATYLDAKYKQTTTFPDVISIQVTLTQFTGVRLRLHYVMTKEGGPVVFEGNSEHCFQDQQGHILRLRKAFPAFAQALDQQLAAGQEA